MANILTRFTDIMSANINALLDKAEDPEKMIDQYMRNIQDDMGKVKAETAAVMASEKAAKRNLDENTAEAAKFEKYAEKALLAGNEADAMTFLEKKNDVSARNADLLKAYEMAKANATRMKELHDKLQKDMESLQERKQAIKAKMSIAKAQESMNKLGSSATGVNDSMSAFSRMEEKANRLMDEAEAMSELNDTSDEAEDLMAKYDSVDTPSSAASDDLAALKAKLGL